MKVRVEGFKIVTVSEYQENFVKTSNIWTAQSKLSYSFNDKTNAWQNLKIIVKKSLIKMI